MPADHRPRAQPGDGFEAAELNQLRDTAPEVIDPQVETFPHVGTARARIADDEFSRENRLWGSAGPEVFVGQIVPHGPDGQQDHEDARYWVREVYESSAFDHPKNGVVDWTPDPNEEIVDENRKFVIRWVTATNLAEVNIKDPSSESHALASTGDTEDPDGNPIVPDDGQLVQVFRVLSRDGTPRFLFSASTGGGDTAFCVIVENPGLTAQTLVVKWVTPDTSFGALRYRMSDDPEEVMTWPLQFGRHFKGFAVVPTTGVVQPGHNVLEATRVDGIWYVKQTLRYTTMHPSPTTDASDCQPHTRLI